MIDVHSHVLPMIDDGSRSIEETVNILKEAHKNGFNGIICTPHYLPGSYESVKESNQIIVDSLNTELSKSWYNFKLYLGNEIFLTNEFADIMQTKKATSMNDSRYVLFELSLNDKPMNVLELIDQIIDYGFVPIMAHPERYSFAKDNPDILNSIISEGVLFQCNYGSLIGQYGRHAKILVEKLLKYDMVSFMGTDCHRQDTIYSKIDECISAMYKIIDAKKFKEITEENPMKLIKNEQLQFKSPHGFSFTFLEKRIMSK